MNKHLWGFTLILMSSVFNIQTYAEQKAEFTYVYKLPFGERCVEMAVSPSDEYIAVLANRPVGDRVLKPVLHLIRIQDKKDKVLDLSPLRKGRIVYSDCVPLFLGKNYLCLHENDDLIIFDIPTLNILLKCKTPIMPFFYSGKDKETLYVYSLENRKITAYRLQDKAFKEVKHESIEFQPGIFHFAITPCGKYVFGVFRGEIKDMLVVYDIKSKRFTSTRDVGDLKYPPTICANHRMICICADPHTGRENTFGLNVEPMPTLQFWYVRDDGQLVLRRRDKVTQTSFTRPYYTNEYVFLVYHPPSFVTLKLRLYYWTSIKMYDVPFTSASYIYASSGSNADSFYFLYSTPSGEEIVKIKISKP